MGYQERKLTHHLPVWATILMGAGGQWALSAFVSTMPPLPLNANYFAKWFYAFLHAVAANIDKVHVPGSAADIAAQPKDGGNGK